MLVPLPFSVRPHGEVVSASSYLTEATASTQGSVVTRALSDEEILDVLRAFGETTRRAIEFKFCDKLV